MTYSTDTRTIQKGDIYVAIRGERYDGHDFVRDAFSKGASGTIVERNIEGVDPSRLTLVEDSILHLAELAQQKIRRTDAQVIAITGSMGKTTTRGAVTQVMRAAGPVVSSIGNLNTLLGLSLTLANSNLERKTRLVLEMGAGKRGDLGEICRYFKPDVSIITNVRGVHLENFDSIQDIQREKSELVRALGSSGTACLNADDELTRSMVADCRGSHLLYGTADDAIITPLQITAECSLLGEHVIYILMAAFAAATAVGIEPELINEALAGLKPEKGRLHRLPGRGGAVLIDDSYNANPDAVNVALNVLRHQTASRRIAILGDMLELGPSELEHHERVLRKAAEVADAVYCCGSRMQLASQEVPKDLSRRIRCFSSSTELIPEIVQGKVYCPQSGDVILVKGSQGARMERVSRILLAEGIPPESVLPRQNEAWLSI